MVQQMTKTLDQDMLELKDWVQVAWRRLADPSLTSFDRRELRNYMKDAEQALRAGFKRVGDREVARREAERAATARRRFDFRIIQLDA